MQHSVMARGFFKRWITRFVPQPAERSTYVLVSSLALIALFVFWEPMGGIVWDVENTLGRALLTIAFSFGWLFAFWATPTMTVAHLVFAVATTAKGLLWLALPLLARGLFSRVRCKPGPHGPGANPRRSPESPPGSDGPHTA